MASFERFDVVRVPFPFTDQQAAKNRPALVISAGAAFNRQAGHSVMAMITSATHAPWPLDVPITDLKSAGLPVPSIVRFKLFTLDHRLARGTLGKLGREDRATIIDVMRRLFLDGLAGPHVVNDDLMSGYSVMAADTKREIYSDARIEEFEKSNTVSPALEARAESFIRKKRGR